MTVTELILQIMQSAFNIAMPFGFNFGIMCVCVWSVPLVVRLFKSIF